MKRGGYDSYGPDEVLNRARERGENVGWDRLFRAAGTAAESAWLVALAVLAVATATLAGRAFPIDLLTVVLIITVVAALISARVAGWLVAPYADPIFRRLMWGLSAAALLLLTIQVGLAVAQLIQILLGGGMVAASMRDFQLAAVVLTLAVAVPVWALYALWRWLRRRPLPQARAARQWRRAVPVVLVLGVAIFDGVYFAT
jgi:hypothetical protein